jgi:hypothetical protein
MREGEVKRAVVGRTRPSRNAFRAVSGIYSTVAERPRPPRNAQRDINASMSACMRSLYSSDQWAPGFSLAVFLGWIGGETLCSLGGFRAPAFSVRVTRDDAELGDEFELFMQ